MFDWEKYCTFAVWKEQETPFPQPFPRGGAREPEVEKGLPTQGC